VSVAAAATHVTPVGEEENVGVAPARLLPRVTTTSTVLAVMAADAAVAVMLYSVASQSVQGVRVQGGRARRLRATARRNSERHLWVGRRLSVVLGAAI
jgi:hypothetical protein